MTTTKQMIEVMQAYLDGERIEGTPKDANEWCELDEPYWDWNKCEYRVKQKPLTREEITAKWVRDNDVKVGDKLKVVDCYSKYFGKEATVYGISDFGIHTDLDFLAVEVFQKLTLKVVPFEFSDIELFRDKWLRKKGQIPQWKTSYITKEGIEVLYLDPSSIKTFEECLIEIEFIDGKPFGKEIWE